jgi:antitoxin component YwqK of YwqJK toxin-antitoxin module
VEGQPLLCEAEFDDNELDGSYKEYYKNGKLKASLTFKNNKADGNAEFYYPSETIKVKGKYKDGSKKGSWKYFAPDGQEFDKKYWKTKNQQ